MNIGESKIKLALDCLGDRQSDFVLKDYRIVIE